MLPVVSALALLLAVGARLARVAGSDDTSQSNPCAAFVQARGMLLDDRVVLDGESAVEGSFGPAGRVLVATSDGGTEFVKQVSAGVKVLVFEAEALALSEVDDRSNTVLEHVTTANFSGRRSVADTKLPPRVGTPPTEEPMSLALLLARIPDPAPSNDFPGGDPVSFVITVSSEFSGLSGNRDIRRRQRSPRTLISQRFKTQP